MRFMSISVGNASFSWFQNVSNAEAKQPIVLASPEGICYVFDIFSRRVRGNKSLNQAIANEWSSVGVLEQGVKETLHFCQCMPAETEVKTSLKEP